MQKLIDLSRALKASGLINAEDVHERGEDGEPEYLADEAGPDLLLFRNTYTGVIELEHASGDLRDVLAFCLMWMKANAADDDTGPQWSGEPVDKAHSDIELRFSFTEEVHYIPAGDDYEGKDKITYLGVVYKRGMNEAAKAETLVGVNVDLT